VIRICSMMIIASLALPACKQHEGPQVAFLIATKERHQKDIKFFEARAEELGLRVVTLAAGNDHAKQVAQVEDMLAQGAKVLVIQPTDSQLASSYVRLAHEKGAKVIAYDRVIIAPDLDYYVSHDSYRVGVLQAQAALAATSNRGKYVILAGQAGDSVATEITRGYKDTLAPHIARGEPDTEPGGPAPTGEIEIVLEQSHSEWSPEQAQRSVEDALARTGNHVDAILANNSAMARGAVRAVGAAGLSKVFIAGAGADAESLELVCKGKQAIDVLEDIEPLARTAAETAKQLFDGEAPMAGSSIALAGKPVPVAAVRVELITADTACKSKLTAAR